MRKPLPIDRAKDWVDSIEKGKAIVEALQYPDAYNRVTTLLDEVPEVGKLTHEVIGHLVGFARETVTRVMNTKKVIYVLLLLLILASDAFGAWTMIESDYSNEINFTAGNKVISWDPPRTNTDTSVLLDLGGYIILCGPSSRNYTLTKTLVGNITQYDTTGWLTPNIYYYCAVKAYNTGIPATIRMGRKNGSNNNSSSYSDFTQ